MPQDRMTEHTAVNDADEENDTWLDGDTASDSTIVLEAPADSLPLLDDTVSESHGIDITSQMLISALSSTHADSFSVVVKSPASDLDTPASVTDTHATYTRAADICWED